jgi:hypothetical protein
MGGAAGVALVKIGYDAARLTGIVGGGNPLSNRATGVHPGSSPFVTWADRAGWVLADAFEPRRMRDHI